MAKAEAKTRPTALSVTEFLNRIPDEERRRDCRTLRTLLREVTGSQAKMWGPSIVGFGNYHYVYASGREGDCFLAGFSPRKKDLTIYITAGIERYPALTAKLGRYRNAVSCLYVKRLSEIDLGVLRKLLAASVRDVRRRYP
jgi:hypothetical protein